MRSVGSSVSALNPVYLMNSEKENIMKNPALNAKRNPKQQEKENINPLFGSFLNVKRPVNA